MKSVQKKVEIILEMQNAMSCKRIVAILSNDQVPVLILVDKSLKIKYNLD